MRRAGFLLCVCGLLVGAPGRLSAGEPTSPRAVVERAIKVHGGAAALKKFEAHTFKDKGKFYGMGEGIPYTGDFAIAGTDRIRMVLAMEVNGAELKITMVVNGKKGWFVIGDDKKPMSKEQLAEQAEQLYAGSLSRLTPLLDKSIKLSLVGEAQVDDRPAIGIRAERKGKRPVNLYFDKKSGLLVKSEFTITDEMAGGAEQSQEVIYRAYKTFKGLKQPTRVLIQRDGKRFLESELTEFQPHESLDESTFAEP
jgi:hypothetical protein